MTHDCKSCGGGFEAPDNSKGRRRIYCSTTCYHAGRVGKATQRWPKKHSYVCEGCSTVFEARADRRRKYCSAACCYAHRTGANHANWKGGRAVIGSGYVMVRVGCRSRAEHRVIAERALGRRMKPNEHVHHINGIKTDNDPRNLLICSNTYHRQLERRMANVYQRQFPVYTLGV